MIWLDVTKSQKARHQSGLIRLGRRLRQELGADATAAAWTEVRERAMPDDWWVTTELFSETERPGLGTFVRSGQCRTAAIFADAIPLKHPQITWPHSVARHPGYMKLLADFTKVWAISEASRADLTGYWEWLGLERQAPVAVLPLGADFNGAPRVRKRRTGAEADPPGLLCVGILEPRKNQLFLLDVCESLWAAGLVFDLHIVGRVNPHFGAPIVARIKRLKRRFSGLHYHQAATDVELARLYVEARATVFATIAEGCGLPLLESLWRGVPCVCSDLPVLRENADGGGCLTVPVNDSGAWGNAIRSIVADDTLPAKLVAEAGARSLPTWAETAQIVRSGLAG